MSNIILGKGKLYFPTLENPAEIIANGPDMIIGDKIFDFKLCERKYTFKGRIDPGPGLNKFRKAIRMMRVRHKATGRTAIAIRGPRGTVMVQWDNICVWGDSAYGWHLYPRHHFKRRKYWK